MMHYPEWEDEILANRQINNRSPQFLTRCCQNWLECTAYFQRIHQRTTTVNAHAQEDEETNFYRDLLASHLTHAVNWWHQSFQRIRAGTSRAHYGASRTHIAEGMHLYWDYLDLIVDDMQSKGWVEGVVPREMLKEAWVVMIMRGFCWWRCHWMMEGGDMCEDVPARLPSAYYKGRGEGVKGKEEPVESEFVVLADGGEEQT
ncbi:MAG: hypothetical protein Q9200_003623 [Gallowayella weberi]